MYMCRGLFVGCQIVMVERLAWSNEPQSFVTLNLVHEVGSPLVSRSVVRIQTKHGPSRLAMEYKWM